MTFTDALALVSAAAAVTQIVLMLLRPRIRFMGVQMIPYPGQVPPFGLSEYDNAVRIHLQNTGYRDVAAGDFDGPITCNVRNARVVGIVVQSDAWRTRISLHTRTDTENSVDVRFAPGLIKRGETITSFLYCDSRPTTSWNIRLLNARPVHGMVTSLKWPVPFVVSLLTIQCAVVILLRGSLPPLLVHFEYWLAYMLMTGAAMVAIHSYVMTREWSTEEVKRGALYSLLRHVDLVGAVARERNTQAGLAQRNDDTTP